MKKVLVILKYGISIPTGVIVAWLLWDYSSWISAFKSLFIGFMSFGIIYAIVEGIIKIIIEEKSKQEYFNNSEPSEFDIYEEDMRIITSFIDRLEKYRQMKIRPKKCDLDHDFERIKLAFDRLLISPYIVDDEIKMDIERLRNSFYLMYLDPKWDKDYKEILNQKKDNS